jgi:hypothetical protein
LFSFVNPIITVGVLDWGPSGQLKKIYLMAEPPSGSPSCSPAMPVPLATEVETQEPSLEKKMRM